MPGRRVKLAGLLDRAGLWRMVLEARARSLMPWSWLTILAFHRVARPGAAGFDRDVQDTTPEAFDRQVATLKRYFTLIDTHVLDAHAQGAPLPPNPAMITFDDGYVDNHDEALPILKRHGAKATFFIATSHIAERRLFWWERLNRALRNTTRDTLTIGYPERTTFDLSTAKRRQAAIGSLLTEIKTRPGLDLDSMLEEIETAAGLAMSADEERRHADAQLMTWNHVRALKTAGMDVQSHTHRHRILQTLTDDQALEDVRTARHVLEEQLQAPVFALAYPAGKSISEHAGLKRAVRLAGYRLGLTCGSGAAPLGRKLDWLSIPRFAVERGMPEAFFRGCLAFPAFAY